MDSHGWMVAVHAGAGYHSLAKEETYKMLCADACRAAANVFNLSSESNCSDEQQVIEAACAAVRVLEDSPFTNAGITIYL